MHISHYVAPKNYDENTFRDWIMNKQIACVIAEETKDIIVCSQQLAKKQWKNVVIDRIHMTWETSIEKVIIEYNQGWQKGVIEIHKEDLLNITSEKKI